MVSDHRRRNDQPQHEGELQGDEKRLGGTGDTELAARNERRDRPHEQTDDVHVLDDDPARQRPDDDREQAVEDAPAQLLDVVEEGHLGPVVTSLRHAGPPRPRPWSGYRPRRWSLSRARVASGERAETAITPAQYV